MLHHYFIITVEYIWYFSERSSHSMVVLVEQPKSYPDSPFSPIYRASFLSPKYKHYV